MVLLIEATTIAAPITQSPASCAGQGGGRSPRPRFTIDTMLAVQAKSNEFSTLFDDPERQLLVRYHGKADV